MEQQETVDKNYLNGFEAGYWLQRGSSKALDGIAKSANNERYKSGLIAGKKEAVREKVRNDLRDHSEPSNDVQKGIDMD